MSAAVNKGKALAQTEKVKPTEKLTAKQEAKQLNITLESLEAIDR